MLVIEFFFLHGINALHPACPLLSSPPFPPFLSFVVSCLCLPSARCLSFPTLLRNGVSVKQSASSFSPPLSPFPASAGSLSWGSATKGVSSSLSLY